MWGCSCGQLAGPGIDWIKRPEPKLIPTQNQASSYLKSLQMLQTAALGADLGESGYCTAIPTNCCVPGGRHGGYCQTLVKKIKKNPSLLETSQIPLPSSWVVPALEGNHPHGCVLCPQVHPSCSVVQRMLCAWD